MLYLATQLTLLGTPSSNYTSISQLIPCMCISNVIQWKTCKILHIYLAEDVTNHEKVFLFSTPILFLRYTLFFSLNTKIQSFPACLREKAHQKT